jgi:RNA polymerase sigma-70 factor, ECF subfamily
MEQGLTDNDFEKLLAPALDTAYRVALRLSRDPDDAADLVRDAVLAAFKGRHTFQPGTHFKAWFLRILTNFYYRSRAKKGIHTEDVPIEDVQEIYLFRKSQAEGLHPETTDPAKEIVDQLSAEQLAAALDRLPEDYRVTATLYLMDNLSYQEIADALDIPIGTVRSRIHRGRNILQKALWSVLTDEDRTALGGAR